MRNGFKKLLESVQEQCPDLITEEVFNEYMNAFDAGIEQIQADANKEVVSAFNAGKEAAAAQMRTETDALIEKLDTEALEKLNTILALIDDNHTAKLQEFYDYVMANYVPRSEMDAALTAQDEECAAALSQYAEAVAAKHEKDIAVLTESIDKKYKVLMEEAVAAVDSEKTEKLLTIEKLFKESREQAVLEERSRKLDILAEGVEKYLNYALNEYKPKSELISEAKYNAAIKTLDKVTSLLTLNAVIQESKDGIFQDYETKLADANTTVNKLISEKIELQDCLNKKEAQLMLESKVQKCTPAEAQFLRNYFKGASSCSIIEEQIEAAHQAWKKHQSETRAKLQDAIVTESKKPSAVIIESEKKAKKESTKRVISEDKEVKSTSIVDLYAQILTNNN